MPKLIEFAAQVPEFRKQNTDVRKNNGAFTDVSTANASIVYKETAVSLFIMFCPEKNVSVSEQANRVNPEWQYFPGSIAFGVKLY